MIEDEKKTILKTGEEVYQTGIDFVNKLDEWSKIIFEYGDDLAQKEIEGDPDFIELNKKLQEVNNRLGKNQ